MKLNGIFILVALSVLFFSGCSNTTSAYYNSLALALEDRSAKLTVEDVKASKADLIQINAGERDTAVIALAYIDGDKYRWLSGDDVIFTMHHGFITQSEGLNADIIYTGNLINNPLALNPLTPHNWERIVDIEGIGYGLNVTSSWHVEGSLSREYIGYSVPLIKVVEKVKFADYSPFVNLNLDWENTYYFHQKSKTLLATTQRFSPEGDQYDMVYLSRIVREMGKQGGEL